LHCFTD
jgi:hypothetical protein